MSALSGRPKCCWNDDTTSRSFRILMENSFKFPHHSLFKHSYRLYRLRSPTDNTADGPSALQVPPAAPRAVAVVGLSNIDAYVSPPTHSDLEPGLALAGTGMSRSPGCRLCSLMNRQSTNATKFTHGKMKFTLLPPMNPR